MCQPRHTKRSDWLYKQVSYCVFVVEILSYDSDKIKSSSSSPHKRGKSPGKISCSLLLIISNNWNTTLVPFRVYSGKVKMFVTSLTTEWSKSIMM